MMPVHWRRCLSCHRECRRVHRGCAARNTRLLEPRDSQSPGQTVLDQYTHTNVCGAMATEQEHTVTPGKNTQLTHRESMTPGKNTQLTHRESMTTGKNTQLTHRESMTPGKNTQLTHRESVTPGKNTHGHTTDAPLHVECCVVKLLTTTSQSLSTGDLTVLLWSRQHSTFNIQHAYTIRWDSKHVTCTCSARVKPHVPAVQGLNPTLTRTCSARVKPHIPAVQGLNAMYLQCKG